MSSEIKVTNKEVSEGVIYAVLTLVVVFLGCRYISRVASGIENIEIAIPLVIFSCIVMNNKNDVKKWIIRAPRCAFLAAIGFVIITACYNSIF